MLEVWRGRGSSGDVVALFQSAGYELSYGLLLDGLPGVKE